MKVLLTTDTYFPIINGVVISTYNLYNELIKLGHEVKILTLSQSGEERIEGDVYYLRSRGTRIYPGVRIGNPFLCNVLEEILKWKPDIIHSQTEFTTFAVARIIRKKLHIPEVHTYHTMYEDYLHYIKISSKIGKSLSRKLTAKLLNSMDGVITPTQKVEEILKSYGMNTNTYIVPTGIDLCKLRSKISDIEKRNILDKYNIPKDIKKLIYIGRIAKEKNLDELIGFYNEIYKDDRVVFIIVGDGPFLEELRGKVKKLGISNKVIFTGMIKNENIGQYYQIGDIFINSSTSETQGLTYIEALASGVPVLCRSDKCNNDLIIDGVNGYKYNNKNEFKKYLDIMISNNQVLDEMKENTTINIEKYSTYNFVKNVEGIYYNLVNNYVEKTRIKYVDKIFKL